MEQTNFKKTSSKDYPRKGRSNDWKPSRFSDSNSSRNGRSRSFKSGDSKFRKDRKDSYKKDSFSSATISEIANFRVKMNKNCQILLECPVCSKEIVTKLASLLKKQQSHYDKYNTETPKDTELSLSYLISNYDRQEYQIKLGLHVSTCEKHATIIQENKDFYLKEKTFLQFLPKV